jgi:hypothetical protein
VHTLEPFAGWLKYYDSSQDDQSPFFGKEYNLDLYSDTVYGYYIDPAWDSFGSETLYLKTLYAGYDQQVAILELIGEWNDTLHNDIMTLKSGFLEVLIDAGIQKFILLGANIMNFHGSDDCYYEEWSQDVEEGWIALVEAAEFVVDEMKKYRLHHYMHMGEAMAIPTWRTLHPQQLLRVVEERLAKRLA